MTAWQSCSFCVEICRLVAWRRGDLAACGVEICRRGTMSQEISEKRHKNKRGVAAWDNVPGKERKAPQEKDTDEIIIGKMHKDDFSIIF